MRQNKPGSVDDPHAPVTPTKKLNLRERDSYITQNGTEFEFGFEYEDGNYTVHILDQPDYGSRDSGCHPTHRIPTDSGHKVCWTGPMPTLSEAKRIAGLWADNTENYILNGTPFSGA